MTMLQGQLTRAEWGVVLGWVVATAVGWLVGFAVCEAFSAFLRSLSSDGLIIGTGVGIAQWLILRRQLNGVGWWVLVTIVGFGVGKLEGDSLAQAVGGTLGAGLGGAAIGTTVGLAQWVVLRRRVAAAGWWVLGSAIGWAVGWAIIGLVPESADTPPAMAYVIGAGGAAVAGVFTAAFLVRLLRARPAPSAQP